ncbi:MAG TPA: hypothetical protein VK009_12125 [Chloroflexota bacterium]|nr:hypothetical protein [Chloroflexota bacterium]
MARTHEAVGMSRRLIALFVLLAALLVMPASALAQASGVPTPVNSAASQPTAPASPGQTQATSPSPAQAAGAPQSTSASVLPSTAGSAAPAGGAAPASAGASAQAGASAAGSAAPAGAAASGSAAASASAAGGAAPASGEASASAAASVPAARALPTPVGANPTQETKEPLNWFAYLLIILAGVWFIAAIAGIIRLVTRPVSPAAAAAIPDAERDRPFLSFIMPFGALITVAIIVTCWGVLFLWLSSINEVYTLAVDLFVVCFVMLVATLMALAGGRKRPTEVH